MSASADRGFGPTLPGRFDFTITFELIMLGMVPAGVIILSIPVYLRSLAKAVPQVQPGFLLWAKLAVGCVLAAVQVASLVMWNRAGLYETNVTLAASIMSLLASLSVVVIIYVAHTFAAKPSSFLSIFLFLTMLFDITMARSYFLRNSLDVLGALEAAIACLKFVLAVLEEVPKSKLLISGAISSNIGATVGFWNRTLLLWINPLLRAGYKNDISVGHLPPIGDEYESSKLNAQFTPHFEKAMGTSKMPLLTACFHTLWWRLLLPVLPRLCYIGFSFSRPFFMQQVMEVVGGYNKSTSTANGLIGASILIFGGLMVSRSIYGRLELYARTCIRGILVSAIYSKVQRLSSDQLQDLAAATLMTTDVTGVNDGLSYIHSTWSSLVELGLGIYVLYTFVSYACFLIFIPASMATAGSYFVTKKMAKARSIWNTEIAKRVAATSNAIAQLKVIKAMGLTEALSVNLERLRIAEINASIPERNARVMNWGTYGFGAAITPVAVLAGARFWTRAANPMTNAEIFATYGAIFIAASPLNELLVRIPFFASGYVCAARIEKFLTLPELKDQRECSTPYPVSHTPATGMSLHGTSTIGPSPYAVVMHNVSVTSESSGPILSNVNLKIPSGGLSMIKGAIGTGKSALLKVILGELGIDAGTIELANKHMAYASQTPWMQNITIQDIVTGPYSYVESIYKAVIHACALERDLAELPDGDQTIVGSNGSKLSGGQKQRLGLARAFFARCSVVVVDDAFSALDDATADLVFQRAFGPKGLLRKWNTTVIMTTNRPVFLSAAAVVFEMGPQGRVRQVKSSRGLSASAPAFLEETSAPETSADTQTVAMETEPPTVDTSKNVEEPGKEKQTRRHGDMQLYTYFLRSTSAWLFVLYFIVDAVAATMERMPQIFMKIWLSTRPDDNRYFAGFVAFSVAEIIITCSSGVAYFHLIVPNTSIELHRRLLYTVMESTPSFVSHTDAGSLLNRFSQDVGLISQQLPLMLCTTLSMFWNVVLDIGILSSGAKYAAVLVLFFIGALYGIQHYYLRTSRQLRILDLETTAPMLTHFSDTNTGISHIRSLGWQESFERQFIGHLNKSQLPFFYLFIIQQWLTLTLDFTTFVAAVVLVTITTVYPQASSDTSIGLALLNLISFSMTASYFLQSWVHTETSLGGLARIKEFCEQTPQEEDDANATDLPESWPSTGKIDFSGVTASYRGVDGDMHEALTNTSFSINPGEKVGIIGRTGSGKSSMFLSLLHMLEFGGSISIDDRDIKTIPRHTLRSQLTTMAQDGLELMDTIRVNVYPYGGKQPDEDAIISTLQLVGIWDHIERHGGLNAKITEARLSHGQKQLLFLARAILHQSTAQTRIVLVDEATSSLDPETDDAIQKLMTEAFADCTVLAIAHKTDYLKQADVTIEFESGKLVKFERRGA